MEMLQEQWDRGRFVCVGLDSDERKIPSTDKLPINQGGFNPDRPQFAFNRAIVDATKYLACAYKPNLAFYRGSYGKDVLTDTIAYIKSVAHDIPVILDAKQADIGNTNDGYVEEDFDYYGADAVTVHPFLGMEAMRPFLNRADKGIIVLCRTSNEGASELQDQPVPSPDGNGTVPLYQLLAHNVSQQWNMNGNCGVVVGATYPEELSHVRQIVGDGFPILIPGIGAQGGELEATVHAGCDSNGQGMIINSSRGIIFASSGEDFAEAARSETQKLHEAIIAVLDAA
jgi:orotidine-5'-phosphate decarboxylase